jgi:hypothetical protein
MGWVPHQDKWHPLSFGHGKLSHRLEVLTVQNNARAEHQSIWASDRPNAGVYATDPGDDGSVVEADNELHAYANLAAPPHNHPDQIRFFTAWRHAIDYGDCPILGFVIRFKYKRALAIATPDLMNLACWR